MKSDPFDAVFTFAYRLFPMTEKSFSAAASTTAQLIAFSILSISSASAAVIYQYTGNNYDSILLEGDRYTYDMKITGGFTVDAPLVNFSGDLIPVVRNWSFNDGVESLTATDDVLSRANMTTDSSGNPVSWEIRMHEQIPVNPVYGDTILTIATVETSAVEIGDTALPVTLMDCVVNDCWEGLTLAWSNSPGTWEVVPIPAALYLFGSGLIGLVGVARRKAG